MKRRGIRALAVLATVLAVSGCAPSAPAPTPVAVPSPNPTVPLALASPSPRVASPSPTSSPTSTPSPSSGDRLGLDWSIDPQPSGTEMAKWLAGIDIGGASWAEFEGGDGFVLMVGEGDGRNAVVWTSADGLTWRRLAKRAQRAPLTNIVRWRGRYVGLAGGDVLESSDGLAWRKTATIPNVIYMNQLAARGTRLVAVGTTVVPSCESECSGAATVWSSRDGRHWQPTALERREGTFAQWVFATPNGFVAISDTFKMWRSSAGLTWRKVRAAPPSAGTSSTLVVRDGRTTEFIAAPQTDEAQPGVPASVWTSTDVRHWHAVPVSGPAIVDGISSLGPYLLVSGSVGAFPDNVPTNWISADGATWTKISLPTGTTWTEWVSGHLIAFGQTQAYVSPPVPGEQLVPSQ